MSKLVFTPAQREAGLLTDFINLIDKMNKTTDKDYDFGAEGNIQMCIKTEELLTIVEFEEAWEGAHYEWLDCEDSVYTSVKVPGRDEWVEMPKDADKEEFLKDYLGKDGEDEEEEAVTDEEFFDNFGKE